MAALFDAVGTAQTGASGTTASIPITIGAIANGAVMVDVNLTGDTVGITATIGGETFSIITGTDGGVTTATVLLGKATGLTGAQTVVVSWTNSQAFRVNAKSFSGVYQTTPFNGGTFDTGSTPKSISITSLDGDITASTNQTTVSAPSTNQTSKWAAGATPFAAGDVGPGTGTTTHTWTGTGIQYMSGANVVAAAAASVTFHERLIGRGLGRGIYR